MGKEKRVPLLVGASGLGASHLLLGGLNLLLFLLKEASKTVLRRLQEVLVPIHPASSTVTRFQKNQYAIYHFKQKALLKRKLWR